MVPSDFAAIPVYFVIAQEGPAVPGASGTGPAVQGSPAGTGPGPSNTANPNPMGMLMWLLPIMLLVMVVLPSLGQKKQKKQREEMMAGLKRGDQVLTGAGIVGSVVEITDHEVLLRVDEGSNTRIRFAKSAIQQVVRQGRDGARTDVEIKPDAAALTDRR